MMLVLGLGLGLGIGLEPQVLVNITADIALWSINKP